jgi:hypothetical protein
VYWWVSECVCESEKKEDVCDEPLCGSCVTEIEMPSN